MKFFTKYLLILILSTLTSALIISNLKAEESRYYFDWSPYYLYDNYWGMRAVDIELDTSKSKFYITIPASSNNKFINGGIESYISFYDLETDTTELVTFTELVSAGLFYNITVNSTLTIDYNFFTTLEIPRLAYDSLNLLIVQGGGYDGGLGVPSGYTLYFLENSYLSYTSGGLDGILSPINPIDAGINNIFAGTTLGVKLLVLTIILIGLSVGLSLLKIPSIIIFTVDISLFALGFILGWIPAWFMVLLVIILFIFILIKLKAGGGGDSI